MRITFKNPDAVDYMLNKYSNELYQEALAKAEQEPGFNKDDFDKEFDSAGKRRELYLKLQKWIEYDEYVRIDFDLDNMTATVVTK